jgi:protoheme ferro-lyase
VRHGFSRTRTPCCWNGAGSNWAISTSFAADCLETLEEIAISYASLYRSHGGGELRYIPSPGHIKALASLLRRHLRGWAPGPRIS